MEKLSGKFIRQYINKKGTTVFVYALKGSEQAIEAYKDAQGDNLRIDEKTGEVLWFTSRFCGDNATIVVNTDKGNIYADMTEFNKIQSLANQFDGALGKEIARQGVSRLLGKSAVVAEETAEKVDA